MSWDWRSAEELVRWMPEVGLKQLELPTSGLADDMRMTLRVPLVDPFILLLANYPIYLESAWTNAKANLSTSYAEHLGDEMRRIALIEPPLGTPFGEHRPKLEDMGFSDERICHVEDLTDTVSYLLPKLLMFALALREALTTERVGGVQSSQQGLWPLPRGLAPGAFDAPLTMLPDVGEEVANLLTHVAAVHQHPRVAGYFRFLANWPPYLQLMWSDLEPLVRTPAYDAKSEMVLNLARDGVHRFPYAVTLNRVAVLKLGLAEESVDEIAQLLEVFALRILPDTIVDVGVGKGLLESRAGAKESRLSLG